MTSRSPPNRRSFVARILGGTLVAGGAVTLIRGPAWASPRGGRRLCGMDADTTDHCVDGDPHDPVRDHDSTDAPGTARRAPSAIPQGPAQSQNSSHNTLGARPTRPTTIRGAPVTDGDQTDLVRR
jgi:hypothetical protein